MKVVKGPRVKERRVAEEMLHEAQLDLDRGRTGITRPKTITLHVWIKTFLEITGERVDRGDLKRRTLVGYSESLVHAEKAMGDIPLRDIGHAELRAFDDRTATGSRREPNKPASRLRHLRHLSACLAAAVDEGYLDANPCRRFTKTLGIEAPKRGKAPFEDDELERLLTALEPYEPVYLAVTRFAVEAGLRLGELVALEWVDVSGDLSREGQAPLGRPRRARGSEGQEAAHDLPHPAGAPGGRGLVPDRRRGRPLGASVPEPAHGRTPHPPDGAASP